MHGRALQPGLLPTFRIFIVLTAITPVFAWRLAQPMLGIRGPLFKMLRSDLVFFVFLMIYTSWPWCRQKMGRAFLPVALIVKTAEPVVRSYLTLSGFVPPAQWEYFTLILMVRLALQFQFTVIFTAWQYELVWPVAVGAVLCAVNGILASPYVKPTSPLRPLYLTILASQFVIVGVGLLTGLLVRNQRRQAAELDDRNRKLAHYASTVEQLAVTQERNRLARELHDTLAHSLSAVAVQIEAAQALSEVDTAGGKKMIGQALETTRSGLTEARRSLKALRASPLEDLGLALAVRDLAESVAARAGLKLELHIGSHLEDLPPEVEQCLYRVAQEALSNVARHANAASVQVGIARDNEHVRLTVEDDGCGFDTAAVADTRYGLMGLRERAESIGGRLYVESAKDKGTKVALEIKAGEEDQ
jgi:signal transduction histidine kinase